MYLAPNSIHNQSREVSLLCKNLTVKYEKKN